jgi:hypothetical protein
VFDDLRALFKYERICIQDINNTEVKSIAISMLNELFSVTLECDYGLYYKAAHALSVGGGEEERKKNLNYVCMDPPPLLKVLTYDSDDCVNKKLVLEMEKDKERMEETEAESENDGEFIQCERDEAYFENIKESEITVRIKNLSQFKENLVQSELFVNLKENFIFYHYLYFVEYDKIKQLTLFVMILSLQISASQQSSY